MLGLYGVVWLVRKLSVGRIDLHYRYILRQAVPAESLLKRRLDGTVSVHRLAGVGLLHEFDRDTNGAFSRPTLDRVWLQRRVERGDICIAARNGSRTVGILFLTFDTFDETEVNARFVVSPQAGMAWDSNLFIVEDARNGLIFVALWDEANAVLREKDYRWSATQTAAFNGPSLQAHKRLGAKRIGRIVYLLIGRWQVTCSTLAPRVHACRRSGAGPVFVIPAATPHTRTSSESG